MPPHAAETSMLVDQQDDSSSSAHPKNVTFAINYELSSVDEFVESPHRQRRVILNPGTPVESIPESTAEDNDPPNLIIHCTNNNNNNTPSNSNNTNNDATNTTATASSSSKDGQSSSFNSENSAPNSSDEDNNEVNSSRSNTGLTPTSTLTTQSADKTRRSARGQQGKRRDATLARTRVRYDMQIVPPVHRNQAFLDIFPLWWMPSTTTRIVPPPQRTQPRRKLPSSSSSSSFLSSSLPEYPACNTCVPLPSPLPPPFLQDTSVIWIPSKRTEWEDSVSEMTAVCTSAALHRHVAAAASASDSTSSSKPIFHPPLSRDYIRDRVDIDDPLLGYQIRHKTGGWLQGFCLWTNFTTWTHYFKWDSLHEQSGMAAVVNDSPKVDRDGSLAQQLEALPREGDPMGGGIVFSAIAEIGLVGALGCGEYLLRMALDGIREKKQYKFVVLQATDSSKAFYEKFGFVRVGAICRYYVGINNASGGGDEEQQPIVGYRHWTHANESDASLQMHGGPSYMMCLKLPPIDGGDDDSPDVVCARCQQRPASARTQPSLLQAMLTLEVDEKPTIEQLGATSTPSLCRTIQRRNSKASSFAATTTDQQAALSNMVKKKARVVVPQPAAPPQQRTASAAPGKRRASPKGPARTVVNPTLPPPPPLTTGARMKRSLSSRSSSSCPELRRPAKKHKPSGTVETIPREVLLSPPPEGKSLTYAQKQYQSVWLAVPPDDVKAVSKNRSRPPPKPRLPDTTTAALMPRDTAERTATTATNTMEVARQTLTTVAVASLDAAEQVVVTTLAIDASAVKASVVQSEPGVAPSAVAKEETADEPPARDVPRRAAAAVAAAAVAASSASAPKKVEKAGIGSKKSDKTDRVPTPPTRELPKRAAGMQKPSAITTAKKSPARARSRSKKSAMPKDEERLYYSVRGPDGRFVRVPIGSTITFTASVKASPKAVTHAITRSLPSHPTSQAATSLRTNKSTTSKISTSISVVNAKRAERSKPVPARIVEKVKHVDRSELRKQKVHSYPRTRPHFYNRVVKPANGSKTYLFVLNYNEDSEQLRLIPMEAKNTLTGQREGRPRYQCVVGDTDANFMTVSAHDYQVVAATMVMKTPFLAFEAWDIEDDD